MASIRRTLSPVPRPGTLLSEQSAPVGSPLSKSSSCAQSQHYPPTTSRGLLFNLLDLLDSHLPSFLGIFSQRSSRSQDRSKLKKQVWRRALCHFFTCFICGVFFGLTPFVSMMNMSTTLVPKRQDFSYEVTSGRIVDIPLHATDRKSNASLLEESTKSIETRDGDLNGTMLNQEFIGNTSKVVCEKLLIIVTPTYARPFQAYHLNRMAYTLKTVRPPLLWVVVEMSSQSVETADMLRKTGIMYRHLVCDKNLSDIKDRSVHQRNAALLHIEMHRLDGITYFADDANIYSLDLFEQIRQISRFGTWAVAKLTGTKKQSIFQGPVCNGSKVIGWHTDEPTRRFRRFHAELSGFAFNSTILWDTEKWHRRSLEPIRQLYNVKKGFQVSTFIEQIVEDESQMECLPKDSSRIMVWNNLHLKAPYSTYPREWIVKSNLDSNDNLSESFIQ